MRFVRHLLAAGGLARWEGDEPSDSLALTITCSACVLGFLAFLFSVLIRGTVAYAGVGS
jgi:hypothetical protein